MSASIPDAASIPPSRASRKRSWRSSEMRAKAHGRQPIVPLATNASDVGSEVHSEFAGNGEIRQKKLPPSTSFSE
ncbi:MAG: hypothetical protein EOP23_21940 [Hyphomicrobiales bacterium]|nr:MAG: hypothetical protein EOP23_21940 [Hyphomicrobiales bacterium]